MFLGLILGVAALGASVEGILPGKYSGYYPTYPGGQFATGGGCLAGQVSSGPCNVYGGCPLGATCNFQTRTCCVNNFATGGGGATQQCLAYPTCSTFSFYNTCPPPYTCSPGGFYGQGRCCIGGLTPPATCPNGQASAGFCSATQPCPSAAYTCTATGSCCLSAATGGGGNAGTCPAPSFTTCYYGARCYPGFSACPIGQSCCPNSCLGGSTCQPLAPIAVPAAAMMVPNAMGPIG